MNRRFLFSRTSAMLGFAIAALSVTTGLQCPPDEDAPLNPPIAEGNRAPRIQITGVETPTGDGSVEQGDVVTVNFTAQDTEDRANVRVFASASDNPTPTDEIPILSSFPVGPGEANGSAFWRTNSVTPGSYFIFAEISDGTFNAADNTGNPPVRSTWTDPVLVVPEGIGDENASPVVTIDLPATDAGLSNEDTLTVRYNVSDADSDEDTLTVRILFDRDRSTANDATDVPLEVATETIAPGTIAPGVIGAFQEDIIIDLNVLPIRLETDEGRRPLPYFVRVQIDDGNDHVVNQYAVGAVRLLRAPSDVVDLINVGSTVAGATWQGFDGNPSNPAGGSRAGSSFAAPGDMDGDGFAEIVIGAETASPFNAPGVGEVYLIYGRQRKIPTDFQAILGFGSGRYAGVNALNTVGSYVPFPSTDPRFERFFNIRGTIIPQEPNFGATSGVSSIAGMPDSTQDGRPDFMVGVPVTRGVFDQEDIDPCDTCTFDETTFAPFDCLSGIELRSGDQSLTAEVDGVETVGALQWAPVDPVGLNPLFPPNVEIDATDGRIIQMFTFSIAVSGERADEGPGQFTVDFQLENENGPIKTLTITPDADGVFNETIQFFDVNPAANFPLIEGEGVPPSVYDGTFLVFVRPSVAVDFDTVEARIAATISTEITSLPIRFTYFDGFPSQFSNNPGCPNLDPQPISPLAIEDFTPVCAPRNRTPFPLTEDGFGNIDGHQCGEPQVGAAIGSAGGLVNDNLSGGLFNTGLVFFEGSNDLVLDVSDGTDVDGDGVPDEGPFGFHGGLGYRVALQRFFGQPPYIAQGGLGMRGGRTRGAWYQPEGIFDPLSRYGHTVDVIRDFDTFGLGSSTTEQLVSAPAGGTLANFPAVDLTADLGGLYDHNNGNPNSREFGSSPFDFGVEFNNILSVTVQISGVATNMPTLRVGLDDGSGRPIANGGPVNFSRDILLWNGAGFPPDEDEPSTIEYIETYGDSVNFNVTAALPASILPQFLSGNGNIAIELLDDCTIQPTSVQINSVELNVAGLLQTGYLVIHQTDDYTCSTCTALEDGRCQPIPPDADPESGETRPMSWPSYGCDSDNQTRVPCSHDIVAYIVGEASRDALGFGHSAGDLNLDGVPDIALGAPGSDNDPFAPDLFCGDEPNPLSNNGKAYIIYGTPTLGTGRPCDLPERFEIRGTHNDDQIGRVQGAAGDMDGDSNPDVFIGGEGYNALGEDFNSDGKPDVGNFGNDVGIVGVLFGRTYGNATRSIRIEQIGTPNFPGVKFVGGTQGARLGGGNKSADADATVFSAGQRGQYGVSSAGDYNLDGLEDLLIAAPGQTWPAGKIEFLGSVTDGDFVSVNGLQFEFDTNDKITSGRIAVKLSATDALTAQRALIDAMVIVSAETLGVSSLQSQNQFPAPLPDTPTINMLRRTYTPLSGWVTSSTSKIKVTEMTRMGVTYLVFGDPTLLTNKTFVLPQDLNRRNNAGKRVLKGVVFVSGYEKDSGPNDTTPDEGPVTTVKGLGDVDGDGFIDIILGAPEADFINIIAPNERRQASGEAYLLYGNSFGLNAATVE